MSAPRTNAVEAVRVAAIGCRQPLSERLAAALDQVEAEVRRFDSPEDVRKAYPDQEPSLLVFELPALGAKRLNQEVERLRRGGLSAPVFVVSEGILSGDQPIAITDIVDFANSAATSTEIVARINRVIHQIAGSPPADSGDAQTPLHNIDGVTIDWRTRDVTYEGVSVHFSTAELRMFEALLARRGGLLSTEELMKAVWGDEQSRTAGLVSVYIWSLRGKLSRLSKAFGIETRVGSGYRLTIGGKGPEKRKSRGPRNGPKSKRSA
ncbi:MAG TPA: winged helix-turn-helix domain-containing protein [Gemmatimonadaceae bacterium]|jgi:DNA-binding response OmpR family regulator